ncbi:MAG TPA: hypothetical protein VGN64_07750 [Dyadobacter sp.]|jgi:hypothetical protein|nr:hypothetical protein [Dyadobacter sp.]
MIRIKIFMILAIAMTINGCSKNTVTFGYFENSQKKKCKIKAGGNYSLKRLSDDNGTREWQIEYPENTKVFITDDDRNGSQTNIYKYKKHGPNVSLQFTHNENLALEGFDSTNGYWKEIKQGRITFGYINLKKEDKSFFEKLMTFSCD